MSHLHIDRIICATPEGTALFPEFSATIARETVGLFGHNGTGKTTLLRAICGEVPVASGTITADGTIGFIRQHGYPDGTTVVQALGVEDPLAMLDRIEQGLGEAHDFEEADWTLPARLEQVLAECGLEGAKTYAKVRHALSGNVYERLGEDRVKVTARDGRTGIFDHAAHHIEGELDHADIQLCDWVGGRLPKGWEEEIDPTTTGPVPERRKAMADQMCEQWRESLGDEVDEISDAEFVDTIYYNLFPNISP